MNAAKKYEQLALDCVNLAEAARPGYPGSFAAAPASVHVWQTRASPILVSGRSTIRPPNPGAANTVSNPHARA